MAGEADSSPKTGRLAESYAAAVTWLRFLLLPAWIAGAVYLGVTVAKPAASENDVISMVPPNARALQTQARAAELFEVPFATDAVVVQYQAGGLSADEQAAVYRRAVATDRAARDGSGPAMVAIPITNTRGLVPGSRESSTTALTYLGFPAVTALTDRVSMAQRYAQAAAAEQQGGFVGVTGAAPGNLREGIIIEDSLVLVEAATVLLVLLVIGLLYRSLVAPLITLAAVGICYLISLSALRLLGEEFGVSLPENLRPLMIALLIGVVTDYCIFYLSCMRGKLERGESRLPAARAAIAEITPIVVASGLILAAGLAALRVSSITFFSDLGPALALTVFVAMLVSISVVPAAMALLGRGLFWPRGPAAVEPGEEVPASAAKPKRLAAFVVRRPVALLIVAVCAAGLAYAVYETRDSRLGFSPISGLPSDTEERRAAAAAADGFAPGMIAPTQLLLQAEGLDERSAELARLEMEVAGEPGVAAVIGPREMPDVGANLAVSENGEAARILVVFDADPHGAVAIEWLRDLQTRMPAIMAGVGLDGVLVDYGGDTALALESVDQMTGDAVRIAAVVLLVNLVLLMLFLRAVVAPIYLVAASALAVMAALGITALVVELLFGGAQLTYFVPFAAGVLLVSLGSDYNVYVTGRVWQEAKVRPLPEAIAVAAPRASRAIRSAGLVLAASFGLLALIPVLAFREFAIAMALGILLETFVVRSLLTPGLVSVFGYVSGWPSRGLRRGEERQQQAPHGEVESII